METSIYNDPLDYFNDDKKPNFDLDLIDYKIKTIDGKDTTFIKEVLCETLDDKIVYDKLHDLFFYDYMTKNGNDIIKYFNIFKENKFKALDEITKDNHFAKQSKKQAKQEKKKLKTNNIKKNKHFI